MSQQNKTTMRVKTRRIIYDLPYVQLLNLYYFIRALLFTKPRPDAPIIIIEDDITDLSHFFGKNYFNGKFPFSWNYRGEELNMRREYYNDSYKFPWRQLHVRGFIVEGKTELQPHEEVSPTGDNEDTDEKMSHQLAHLKGIESSSERGVDMLKNILEDREIEYQLIND